jgi:hypothetical protein
LKGRRRAVKTGESNYRSTQGTAKSGEGEEEEEEAERKKERRMQVLRQAGERVPVCTLRMD